MRLRVMESALLLASLRRLIRPADGPPLSPARSQAYFLSVIDELLAHPAPDNYLEYLRLKLCRIAEERGTPAKVQKKMIANTQFPGLKSKATFEVAHLRSCTVPERSNDEPAFARRGSADFAFQGAGFASPLRSLAASTPLAQRPRPPSSGSSVFGPSRAWDKGQDVER